MYDKGRFFTFPAAANKDLQKKKTKKQKKKTEKCQTTGHITKTHTALRLSARAVNKIRKQCMQTSVNTHSSLKSRMQPDKHAHVGRQRDLQCSGTEWVTLSSQPNNGIPLSFISNSAESHTHTLSPLGPSRCYKTSGHRSMHFHSPTVSQSVIQWHSVILIAEGSHLSVPCSFCALPRVKRRLCPTLRRVKTTPSFEICRAALGFHRELFPPPRQILTAQHLPNTCMQLHMPGNWNSLRKGGRENLASG